MSFDVLKEKKASFGFVVIEVVNIPHLIVEENLVENKKPLYQNFLALNVAKNSGRYQERRGSFGDVVGIKRGVNLLHRIRLENPF